MMMSFFLGKVIPEMMFAAKGDSIDSISWFNYKKFTFTVGFPVTSRILSIWFKVEFPGNMALPSMSSPKIHPTDHMSTAFEYCVEPKRI